MKKIVKCAVSAFAVAIAVLGSGCGEKETNVPSEEFSTGYTDVILGETGTDLHVTLKLLNHKTDMLQSDYNGVSWAEYLAEFNKMYPGITVEIDGITDYAEQALLRLQGGNWGDIMMIPAIDQKDLSQYFLSFGSVSEMKKVARFVTQWMYDDKVYGIPYMATAQGVLYNKRIFKEAGVESLPKTPDEFIAALKKIKQNTSAIPLYTNYATGWTMGAWDAYISGSATGKADYMNQTLVHEKNPFRNYGDNTHAYAVYKVLYDAVAAGLTESDYTTTDWESSKGMLNRGEIGTMVLGSWAFTQMQGAGEHGEDIGYMSFPITINGKQYASAGPDYCYGINVKSSAEKKLAALIFVKWLTEKSGFSYNEGGIPISLFDTHYPALYAAFDGIDFIEDVPARVGEEDLRSALNADSELNVNNGGNMKIQKIIESAANGDVSFDAIMDEWNKAWSEAQKRNGVSIE